MKKWVAFKKIISGKGCGTVLTRTEVDGFRCASKSPTNPNWCILY